MEENKRIFGLDLMRATAILLVVIGHFHWIIPNCKGIVSQVLLISGFLGVEVFFVLSGFLIGQILLNLYLKDDFKLSSVFYFLKRRWFRTLPNYYLVLLINICIALYIGYEFDNYFDYFFFLQNFCTPLTPFFTESWSLSVEEYAYLFLPFLILLFSNIFKPKNKFLFFRNIIISLIILFIGTKIVYHFFTNDVTLDDWNTGLKSVVIYRLDSIFIGVFFGWLSIRFSVFLEKNKVILLGICFFSILFYFIGIGYFRILIETHRLYWNVLYLPLLSIGIACSLPFLSSWKTENSFIRKPITFISKISYSMYLLHYGIIMQLMKYFFKTETFSNIEVFLFFVLYLFITIVLSSILYRFYEKPIMDMRDKN